MPRGPVPAEVSAFLAEPNLAIIATLRPDGAPHTATTWFAWDGERILLSMDESRLRLRFIRNDPRVSLTIPDSGFTVPQAAHRMVSVNGRVVELRDDPELADFDVLALRYTGQPYPNREARRVTAIVEIDSWYGWEHASHWPPRSGD